MPIFQSITGLNGLINTRDVFRTQLKIYDGAFLQKVLTAKSRKVFLQKSFIV